MLEKLKDEAAAVFGLTDWVKDLAPGAPVVDADTIAISHAYRNSESYSPRYKDTGRHECIEWLELRSNATAHPNFVSSGKPAFSFSGDSMEIGSDGSKFPVGLFETVIAPKDIVPEKYTLFRREIRPLDPTVAAYFFMDVHHGRAIYQTTVEKADIDLPEARMLINVFEQAHAGDELIDTNRPDSKYYNEATAGSRPAPRAP